MTEETPVKVLSLLGVSLASMFLLFVVTVSQASFEKMETPFPDPFNPAQVMAGLDNAANSYSHFLAVNLTEPLNQEMAMLKDSTDWVIGNSDMAILNITGLTSFAEASAVESSPASPVQEVAGAYTQQPDAYYALQIASNHKSTLSVDTLYYLLFR